MIEREIFGRRIVLLEKVEKFGFIRVKEGYIYERRIYDGMIARVTISSCGEVSGDVYDAELGEVYVNHRLESASGAFVIGVRNAYEGLLREIAEAVTLPKTYINDQANRIDAFIREKYGVSPEFLWAKFPHFGVYRNALSDKWFAIIMNISRAKVIKGKDGEVEVMNLKLDDYAEEYLGKGVYPSYHMNHKSWVSVLLDDTIPDEKIVAMIEISYRNSFGKGKKKK